MSQGAPCFVRHSGPGDRGVFRADDDGGDAEEVPGIVFFSSTTGPGLAQVDIQAPPMLKGDPGPEFIPEVIAAAAVFQFGSSGDVSQIPLDFTAGREQVIRLTHSMLYSIGGEIGDTQTDDLGLTINVDTPPTVITATREPTGWDGDVFGLAETIAYFGSAAGDNEFVIIDRRDVSIPAGQTTTNFAISPTDSNDVVAFCSGARIDAATNEYANMMCHAEATGNTVTVTRNGSTGNFVAAVTTVEFVGANWTANWVKIPVTAVGSTQNPAFAGLTSRTPVSITDWNRTFTHVHMRHDIGVTVTVRLPMGLPFGRAERQQTSTTAVPQIQAPWVLTTKRLCI